MYCRNCGSQVDDKAEICVHCGVRVTNGDNYCQNCGAETSEKQEMCVKCGSMLEKYQPKKNNFGDFTFSSSGGKKPNYDFSELPPYYQGEFQAIKDSDGSYKGKFNWAAFFFGPLWMMYKGMVIQGLIYLIVNIVVSSISFLLLGLVLDILVAFRANYLYYNVYTTNETKLF